MKVVLILLALFYVLFSYVVYKRYKRNVANEMQKSKV